MMNVLPAVSDLHEIDIARARLPETYEAATKALAECQRIDECQDWSNKAEAIAAYARMAKDDRLYKMAVRIQARAVRRVGELLGQFKKPGARTDRPDPRGGVRCQKEAGKAAGLSRRQIDKAASVASISIDRFEAAIESDEPMTAGQIAALNTRPMPEGFHQARHLLGTLRRFAEFCDSNPPHEVAQGLLPHEVADACRMSERIEGWLQVFACSASSRADHRRIVRATRIWTGDSINSGAN